MGDIEQKETKETKRSSRSACGLLWGSFRKLSMFGVTIRDVVWAIAMLLLAGAWWWDRSGLANSLKNARFAIEHQREVIESLSSGPGEP
jgi:hypothetical protein